ncbi:MAG: MmgE/PrpD family protein, partial [PS1 clade bacterium]
KLNNVYNFIYNIDWNELPITVQNMSKRCLLDTLGVALSARTTEASQIGAKFAAMNFGPTDQSRSRLLGFDGTCSVPGAAFSGAILIDSMDAHDGHRLTKGHAGATVLPSLLSMADNLINNKTAISGKYFLELLVIGYEVSLRSGIELHKNTDEYPTSGSWAAIGVAAMGAKLLKLDKRQLNHALGIAEYYAPRSPMMRCIDQPTMVKDGAGWGALTGVSSVFLAQEGFTGAPALCVTQADEKDYFLRYEILNQYFKPWPICRWAQPAVEAIVRLQKQYSFNVKDIKEINISTFHNAVRLANKAPTSSDEAQYSIGYPVAAMLVRGKISPEEMSISSLNDTKIKQLQSKIKLEENQNHTNAFPAKRYASVVITLQNGEKLQLENIEARGDPDNPLSDAEIETKFVQLTEGVISSSKQNQLIQLIDNLEKEDDINALLSLILGRPS